MVRVLYNTTPTTPGDPTANPAATIQWDGSANDSDWTTASNWDLNRVPGAGDVVQINATSQDISAASLTSINLDGLYCGPQWTGSITGGTLALSSIALLLINKPVGTLNISGHVNNAYITDTDGSSTAAVTLAATAPRRLGSIWLKKTRGTVVISNSTRLHNLYAIPDFNTTVSVSIGTSVVSLSGSRMDLLHVGRGAHVTTGSGARTTIVEDGGVLTKTDDADDDVVVISGYLNDQASGGINTSLTTWQGGQFTLDGNNNASHTTAAATIYPDSIQDYRTGTQAAAITAGVVNNGGTMLFDEGTTVTTA